MDERYAYISTEMEGYVGNILVIYDCAIRASPQEVSRWWMPGQHIAGGETPTWSGRRHRLHHALRFGNEMWASCWHGGFWVVDVSDLAKPKSAGSYNYHPLFPEPTHTVMPVPDRIGGRRIALAIDEEDQAQSASEEEARRGRAHACILTFDVSDLGAIKPLGAVPGERARLARSAARPARASARTSSASACPARSSTRSGSAAACASSTSPTRSARARSAISSRSRWRARPRRRATTWRSTQRGLIYMVDRHVGFDMLEFEGLTRGRADRGEPVAPCSFRGEE